MFFYLLGDLLNPRIAYSFFYLYLALVLLIY